jgi:hypothetical protein
MVYNVKSVISFIKVLLILILINFFLDIIIFILENEVELLLEKIKLSNSINSENIFNTCEAKENQEIIVSDSNISVHLMETNSHDIKTIIYTSIFKK